jgi:hypothetical protein
VTFCCNLVKINCVSVWIRPKKEGSHCCEPWLADRTGLHEGSDTIDFQRFNFLVAVDGRGRTKNRYCYTKTYAFKRNSTKIRGEIHPKPLVSAGGHALSAFPLDGGGLNILRPVTHLENGNGLGLDVEGYTKC